MPGRYLLDTNIVIALFNGDPAVTEQLAGVEYAAISVTVLGELAAGALKSSRAQENLLRLDQFADAAVVLSCDRKTAMHYAQVQTALFRKGKPIPEADLWIAATAQQHGLSLVTRDRHFDNVDGLEIARW